MPELRVSSIRVIQNINYRELIKEAKANGERMFIEDCIILNGTEYDNWGLNHDVDFSF
jgi:hypothetical protein